MMLIIMGSLIMMVIRCVANKPPRLFAAATGSTVALPK